MRLMIHISRAERCIAVSSIGETCDVRCLIVAYTDTLALRCQHTFAFVPHVCMRRTCIGTGWSDACVCTHRSYRRHASLDDIAPRSLIVSALRLGLSWCATHAKESRRVGKSVKSEIPNESERVNTDITSAHIVRRNNGIFQIRRRWQTEGSSGRQFRNFII